mmetsp:Transcript_33857/g.62237  ORF Transcript_33857/g.62237 Transcript_33857/m.62237 type:complete len:367 (+) Transcript_33857:425-1525(+)
MRGPKGRPACRRGQHGAHPHSQRHDQGVTARHAPNHVGHERGDVPLPRSGVVVPLGVEQLQRAHRALDQPPVRDLQHHVQLGRVVGGEGLCEEGGQGFGGGRLELELGFFAFGFGCFFPVVLLLVLLVRLLHGRGEEGEALCDALSRRAVLLRVAKFNLRDLLASLRLGRSVLRLLRQRQIHRRRCLPPLIPGGQCNALRRLPLLPLLAVVPVRERGADRHRPLDPTVRHGFGGQLRSGSGGGTPASFGPSEEERDFLGGPARMEPRVEEGVPGGSVLRVGSQLRSRHLGRQRRGRGRGGGVGRGDDEERGDARLRLKCQQSQLLSIVSGLSHVQMSNGGVIIGRQECNRSQLSLVLLVVILVAGE